jgi:hypothetical protein
VLGRAGIAVMSVLLLAHGAAQQPQIQFGDRAAESRKSHVVLLTDSAEVSAGSPQEIEVRFRVEPGYHINSHAPKDELLLPTSLKLEPAEAIKLLGELYPAGTAFRLPFDDTQTLDVYENEFRVRVRVQARRGNTTLAGELHYQACDNAACFPPRTLPVKVLVTAK